MEQAEIIDTFGTYQIPFHPLFIIAINPLQQILELITKKGILHKICGRGTMVRISLYSCDATICMGLIKGDIHNLMGLLRGFGEFTGLCTNFHKSSVVPI